MKTRNDDRELDIQVKIYFELLQDIADLQAQAENIKDLVKTKMVEMTTEELTGCQWSATWHNTTTSRFDSKAFQAAQPEVYKQFCKTSTGTRFTLQQVKTA